SYTGMVGKAVRVNGNLAYVAGCDTNGTQSLLRIVNIANPSTPATLGSFSPTGSTFFFDVAIAGNYAYAVDNQSLYVIDVSNPSSPIARGTYHSSYSALAAVATEGSFAYIAAPNNGVDVVDVSNPDNPSHVSLFNTPGQATALIVKQGLVYC